MTRSLMPFLFPSPDYPSKLRYFQTCPFFFFLLFFLLPKPSTSRVQLHPWSPSFADPRIPYSDHCDHIVPESPVDPSSAAVVSGGLSLRFDIGFFSGGDGFFDGNRPPNVLPKLATFLPISVRRTLGDQKVYKVEASLSLRMPRSFSSSYYSGDLRHKMQMMSSSGGRRFSFSGFWSESTGRLCMVGLGSFYSAPGNLRPFDALLMLNYSKDSSIYGCLIRGVLASASDMGNESYFEPISILGVARNTVNYEYKLLERGKTDCGKNIQESLSLESVRGGLCSVFGQNTHVLSLGYENGCGGNRTCSPFGSDITGYIPDYMAMFPNMCGKVRMQMLLSFGNGSSLDSSFPFDPNTTLVAEGAWDAGKNRFCCVVCRILNFSKSLSNAVIDDCSMRLSFSFPAVLSVRRMGSVVGQLWSVKKESDSGFFSRIEVWSLREPLWHFPSLRYEYTLSESVGKSCVSSMSSRKRRGKDYPDAQSSDMRFHMKTRNNAGDRATLYAHATPLFVGNQLYGNLLMLGQGAGQSRFSQNINNVHSSFTNISYRIRFSSDFDASGLRSREIYAEGTYDRDTGILCMIGCQSLRPKNGRLGKNYSLDCNITINVKFSPIQSRTDYRLKGTIESTREMKDPLYFGRIEILSRSIYASEARASVWRMDFEMAMVLISNTLSCFLVGLQLHHMKKHPDALPFISMVMLMTLTMGHMIPLLLNFEALFKTYHNQRNMLFENDTWLEANEIGMRMVTMVAFLLEFRLLLLAWTARKNGDSKSIWDAEKKVFYIFSPLYVTGGFIACLVNLRRKPYARIYMGRPRLRHLLYRPFYLKRSYQRPSLWKDLKSYGGLILDGFLMPQILFNIFCNSKEKALAALFYVGTTIVRLLPHAYDLYRGHNYGNILDWSYIYANHKMDYYSTAWDFVILFAGLLFAFLIFLQQQFGSRCFLPKKFIRDSVGYERVSGEASVELQEAADTEEPK